ncbi:UNVERIFIED_CONTAM: hypothetical protein Slati_0445700 [Sesamum latifolium]|uniref:Uncharacterized protein n=1 Tax=Sesamum latifolium TaxID=2727402 RepID=A0AAW2XW31_9LAMI
MRLQASSSSPPATGSECEEDADNGEDFIKVYLNFTCPDISHFLQQLSQYLQHPCELHWYVAFHVICYLKGYPSKGLMFPSTKVKCRSMGVVICELKWISYLLQDFGVDVELPIPLFSDNKTALHITANPMFHEDIKHLKIDCHIIRDAFEHGFIDSSHVHSADQLVDMFT